LNIFTRSPQEKEEIFSQLKPYSSKELERVLESKQRAVLQTQKSKPLPQLPPTPFDGADSSTAAKRASPKVKRAGVVKCKSKGGWKECYFELLSDELAFSRKSTDEKRKSIALASATLELFPKQDLVLSITDGKLKMLLSFESQNHIDEWLASFASCGLTLTK
jgi:hypothetical protein